MSRKKPSRSERRRQREAEKAEKNRRKKEKLLKFPQGTHPPEKQPVTPFVPPPLKEVRYELEVKREKSVRLPQDASLYNSSLFTWSKRDADLDGTWSCGESKRWTEEEWQQKIAPKLAHFEKLTWSEIYQQKVSAKGGKWVPKHHEQEISSLGEEFQSRWRDLGLEEFQTAFRLRFSAKARIWGIKIKAHFYIVWWDRNHVVYPTSKS